MKVFLSWSGPQSKAIAEALRSWLPSVLQAVKPYFSPEDIIKGSRWSADIASQLSECQVGIICLTPANLNAPWILFEAGALAKNLETSKVVPLLIGVTPSNVVGPLAQFQLSSFDEAEMRKLINMINGELPEPVAQSVLDAGFKMWWPQLAAQVSAIETQPVNAVAAPPERKDREVLDEILALLRQQESQANSGSLISHQKLEQIAAGTRVPDSFPITYFGFGETITNDLMDAGINTVSKLCQQSAKDLIGLPNVGRNALNRIKSQLFAVGRNLRPDVDY